MAVSITLELIIHNLKIPIENDGSDAYLIAAAKKLKIGADSISITRILSKALDLSSKEQFFYKISLVVRVPASFQNAQKFPSYFE